MKTYIQALKELSRKPRNIKALLRKNFLEEYIQEIKQKFILGIPLDEKVRKQSLVAKYNLVELAESIVKGNEELNNHLEKMRNEIPYHEISSAIKQHQFVGYSVPYSLSNNYSFLISSKRGLEIYYKDFLLITKECLSYNYDTGRNYIDHEKLVA